jgi:ABC-type polysaccharide/polyol phosphate export permease
MLAWRDVQVKYKQSIMGMLWAVLMPLVIVSAGLVVRFAFARLSGEAVSTTDLTTVAVKAVPWAFFVASLRFGTTSLVTNVNLVTKIYLPRLIFPLAAVLSQAFDFLIASTVVVILLIAVQAGISLQIFWVIPILLTLALLASAVAIVSSAASLFFRDVKYIVEVVLTFAIFFTPVFYDSTMFGSWGSLLLLNPVSPLLEGIASTVIHHQGPQLAWLAYSAGMTVVLLAGALTMFKRVEPYFAESI